MVRYLKHYNIDKQRWNDTIEQSHNRLVYATSWYLDIVAPGWEALVEDDYKSIMPLPAKKKYGIPYLIQPKFVQQLGIFSPNKIDTDLVNDYLHNIPRKFVWQCFQWNSKNPMNGIQGIGVRFNYELILKDRYESIFSNYNENTQRNIVKANKSGIQIEQMNDFCGFHQLYQRYSRHAPNEGAIYQLQQLIDASLSKRMGHIMMARNLKMEIVAGAFFLIAFDRIIYLTSFVTEEGYSNSAMFLIMDEMIKRYSSGLSVLDFEGSMIPGIARFFEGFGGVKTTYFEYKKRLT